MLAVKQEQKKNVGLAVSQTLTAWTKGNDRDFRRLALKEATGEITREEMRRLNRLSAASDRCLNPMSTEEVLLQIRRDLILGKMAQALQDYVEFTESTHNKGTAA